MIEQYEKPVNGESIMDFITKIQDAHRTTGTIYLVLDSAGYQRSGLIAEYAMNRM
jgi:hypothetical protein